MIGLGIIFIWDKVYGIGFNADWGANYNTHRRRKIFGNLRNGAKEGGEADDWLIKIMPYNQENIWFGYLEKLKKHIKGILFED